MDNSGLRGIDSVDG